VAKVLYLVCALPNRGSRGVPRGLFYDKGTEEGRRQAEEFMKREDRPGWGVFDSIAGWRAEAVGLELFNSILEENGVVMENGVVVTDAE
jgi:hypothetical protein